MENTDFTGSALSEPHILPKSHPLNRATANAPLVKASRGERSERLPVWFMRQAGRSLPEYRELRKGVAMLDSCLRPEMAAEITLQPVRRHGVDAAVFFSDIVVPLKLAGIDVSIAPGVGPVFERPIRTLAEVDDFCAKIYRALEDETLFAVIEEAVRITAYELGETPLIGFAGAPFTLAAYAVEGKPSRDHLQARALMAGEPTVWEKLVVALADLSAAFLAAQIRAGASVGQLFDSWAGTLSPERYRASLQQASARVLSAIRAHKTTDGEHVRAIHFGVGTARLLPDFLAAGADVVGVDERIELSQAIDLLGGNVPVQGNIDPSLLFAGWDALSAHAADVISAGRGAPAHIVNLGHGVPPECDPAVLTRLVEFIHEQ